MRLLLAYLAIALICGMMTAFHVTAEQRPAVVTCTLDTESATGNTRTEVMYYECLAVNGAVVPSVTFIVHGGSAGDEWLRELSGRTVDVRLEVVK